MKMVVECGNSQSRVTTNSSGVNVFRKQFSSGRDYQFYNEYFCSMYLHKLASGLTTRIVSVNRVHRYIDYELCAGADDNLVNNNAYLNLVKRIHQLSTPNLPSAITLNANQPLVTVEEFLSKCKIRLVNLDSLELVVDDSKFKSLVSDFSRKLLQICKLLGEKKLCSIPCFSQADSGVHNCVIGLDGELLLADLEYAGIDSPIKQCIDFLLHPRCQRTTESHQAWWTYFQSEVFDSRDLQLVPCLASALCLKWAIIMLNEFRPEIWSLRISANPSRREVCQTILQSQFTKSIIYYNKVQDLLDGAPPYDLFTQNERDILSRSY